MESIIRAGLESQLSTRNELLSECIDVLDKLLPDALKSLVLWYSHGDDKLLPLAVADIILDFTHKTTFSGINIKIWMTIVPCIHNCCVSGPYFEMGIDSPEIEPDTYLSMWGYVLHREIPTTTTLLGDVILDQTTIGKDYDYDGIFIGTMLLEGIRNDIISHAKAREQICCDLGALDNDCMIHGSMPIHTNPSKPIHTNKS
jgi:hypothetical protein